MTPSSKSRSAGTNDKTDKKGTGKNEAKVGTTRATKSSATSKEPASSKARPKARVQVPSPRASSRASGAATRSRRGGTADRTRDDVDDLEAVDDDEIDEIDEIEDDDELEGADEAARPTGWRALLAPTDPNYIPPAERERPWWGMGDMALWFLVAQVAAAIGWQIAISVGNYSLYWPMSSGARAGEVVGRIASGQAPSLTKTILDMPLAVQQAIQIPLWIGFLGGPVYAAKRKGTSLKEDFGLSMQWKDVPLGLAIGAFAQVVLLTILYKVIFIWTGEQDVSAQARELTSKATTPALTALLVLGVAMIAPVMEELFFRGLSQRAIAKRLGPTLGVVLSALFFALAHFQTLQFPGLLAFGLILGYLAHRFGRLGPSIWAHIGFNLVAAVLLVWNVNLP